MAADDDVLTTDDARLASLVGGAVVPEGFDREPLGRKIATAVARQIILGEIPPGQPLSQEALCARFGTSRMPVRDALRELAAAGYLDRGVGHKLTVARLTRQDVEDFFALEATLSGLIAQRAAERRTAEELTTLRSLQDATCRAVEEHDGLRMSALNRAFHEFIHQVARSAPLVAAYRNTTIHVEWNYYAEQPGRMEIGCNEHGEIIEAISAGDRQRAYDLMVNHIATAQKYRSTQASVDSRRLS